MNNYSISLLLVFSMIFSLLFLSVKKVETLYRDLNAPYNFTYSSNIQVEGETLSQKIAKAASNELTFKEYMNTESNIRYCGLYGSYSLYGYYGLYGSLYASYSGYGGYGGLY